MRRRRSRYPLSTLLVAGLAFAGVARVAAPHDSQTASSPLLEAMKVELDRSMKTLGTQDPPAYFISYAITDTKRTTVSGSNGALLNSDETRNRWLESALRTGSYDLDSTHKVDGRQPPDGGPGANVPLDDDPEVIGPAIWLETDKQYRAAAEAFIKIKAGKEVKVQTEEGRAPDFSREKPQVSASPWMSYTLDRKPW